MSADSQNRPLKTFLRGGQVTMHTLRMFGQVISFMVLAMAALGVTVTGVGVWRNTEPMERHYAFKRYEAWGYAQFPMSQDVKLNVRTQNGGSDPVPVWTILTSPTVAAYERRFRAVLIHWSVIGAGVSILGLMCFVALFLQRGGALTATSVKRGAAMVPATDLRALVTRHNQGRKRRHKALRRWPSYTIAGVPYPVGSETQHTPFLGPLDRARPKPSARSWSKSAPRGIGLWCLI